MSAKKEIRLKQWFSDQAARDGISRACAVERYYRGKYPGLKLRRVSPRVIFVVSQPALKIINEIPLKQWIYEEAVRCGVKPSTIWGRYNRGKYPELKLRKINSAKVMVAQ